RRAVVSRNPAAGAERLGASGHSGYSQATERPVAFLFPGQGAQYAGMTKGLYDEERVYREAIDECCSKLQKALGFDLKTVLFAPESESATARLRETSVTQPAIFVVEYALAKLWMSFGVSPSAFIGHSIGEYVAAHLAGVLGLDDALALIAERGRLMQSLPAGAMLAVALPSTEVEALLRQAPELSLAASNSPSLSVVSGPAEAVSRFEKELVEREVFCNRLHTSHAFHSSMMDPILEEFERRVASTKLSPPTLPYVSNLTGTWIEAGEATSPRYWARHLREAVQFSKGIATLWSKPDRILLEVGPGATLRTLAKQQAAGDASRVAISSVRGPRDTETDLDFLLGALGQLWVAGASVDFEGFHRGEKRRRVAIPTYPFEREKYWIDAQSARPAASRPSLGAKRADVSDWFYVPSWKSSLPPDSIERGEPEARSGSWLFFLDREGILLRVAERLRERGVDVVTVSAGERFSGTSREGFVIAPGVPLEYTKLLRQIEDSNRTVGTIVHGWSVGPLSSEEPSASTFAKAQELGYFSVANLVQALSERSWTQP
ncbi:MAG: acyltransferase domain-containing protein, partial [Vicinamibacteria bacterium]